MHEEGLSLPELPNIISLIAEECKGTAFSQFLFKWENVIYSLIVGIIIFSVMYLASRRMSLVPNKLQNFAEMIVFNITDFIEGILGSHGRQYVPFIGTLFIYILSLNLFGLIPFMKSSTSSLSTTLSLSLCVFAYVQYAAFKNLGFLGYFKHLMGNPEKSIAMTGIIPLFMLALHTIAEFIRPISLSLRLRSNVWGDDLMLALFTGFGIKGFILLFVNTILTLISTVLQAAVFCILTTVYFSLVTEHE